MVVAQFGKFITIHCASDDTQNAPAKRKNAFEVRR